MRHEPSRSGSGYVETPASMTHESTPPPGRIFPWLALFILLGMPLIAYLWETLHQILALHVEPVRMLISIPVLGLFVALLKMLGRKLEA